MKLKQAVVTGIGVAPQNERGPVRELRIGQSVNRKVEDSEIAEGLCGYLRLAPFGATRSSRILALMGVGAVRLFSSRSRQPFKLSVGAPKYPAAGKSLGKLHLSL